MPNQKKRTAWSVSDVVSGKSNAKMQPNPRFKSGYSGPKKSKSDFMDRYNAERTGSLPVEETAGLTGSFSGKNLPTNAHKKSSYSGPNVNISREPVMVGGYGILDYAWIAVALVMGICLTVTILVYNANAGKKDGYVYPSYVFTMNGVLNAIYDDYANGGLGSAYANASTASSDSAQQTESDSGSLLGDAVNTSTLPNTTTGATMTLDTGSTYGEYGIAGSYDELLTQLGSALEANDFGFVGMKLCYEDESSGELIGYPQSVVEHFTQYMSDNTGKREVFLTQIRDEDTYMVKNGSAYLVKLPMLQFTIHVGYDTTFSISGFADQQLSAGSNAVVSPLLPCMYTITVTTADGIQSSSDVECDMSEGDLQIDIGVSSE